MARSETYPGSGAYMYPDAQAKAAYASDIAIKGSNEPGVKMPEIQGQVAELQTQAEHCEGLAKEVRARFGSVLRPLPSMDGCSEPARLIETGLGTSLAQIKGIVGAASAVLEEILLRNEL